jgi:hypothetical protein
MIVCEAPPAYVRDRPGPWSGGLGDPSLQVRGKKLRRGGIREAT